MESKKMNYFKNCKSLEELKKEYRKLMIKFHPDKNPDNINESTKITAEINNEYEKMFELLKNIRKNYKNEYYEKKETTKETSKDFIKIIDELLKHKDIKIDLIGNWLWVYGKTKPIKETLKKLGFIWNSKRLMWYWRKDENKVKKSTNLEYEKIKEIYGCESFENNNTENEKLKLNFN